MGSLVAGRRVFRTVVLTSGVLLATVWVFAIPSAFAAGPSDKSATGAVDRKPSWSVNQHTFTLRLNAHTFTVPIEYLGTFTPEEEATGGRPGMALQALLPTLEPDTIPVEQRGPSDAIHKSILIAVKWPMRGGAANALDAWVRGTTELQVGRGHPGPIENGLQLIKGDAGSAWFKHSLLDMYRVPSSVADGTPKDAVLFCNPATTLTPESRCQDAFIYRDLLVTLYYDHAHLKEWASIRRAVVGRLDGWCLDCAPDGPLMNNGEKR